MRTLPPTGRTFTLLFLALLAIGIGAAYSGGFGIGFYFDDAIGIAHNPSIRSLRNIPSFFTDPYATWARSALLCVTLYLGAFLVYLRRRWALGSVLFVLALLTKAIAVTLPVMFLIHDFVYRDRTRHPTVRSYLGDWRRLALPVLL